jgi:hypothetical protein
MFVKAFFFLTYKLSFLFRTFNLKIAFSYIHGNRNSNRIIVDSTSFDCWLCLHFIPSYAPKRQVGKRQKPLRV